MAAFQEIDVRSLPPIKRHEQLLQRFDDMKAGEGFVLVNDHDPKPLYYEFRSIYGDVINWEYLSTGGDEWKVQIQKTADPKGEDFEGTQTMIDLRQTDRKDWKHTVFHRFSMMRVHDTMRIVADDDPVELKETLEKAYDEKTYYWEYREKASGKVIVHLTKKAATQSPNEPGTEVVKDFDVRPYHPAQRHEMIFGSFNELNPGEAFVFTNDHDPIPLYYQFEAENPGQFEWEYLEKGPEVFQVKITRNAAQ